MDRDTVIRLAREAGAKGVNMYGMWHIRAADLEYFATLVAAHEREECAKVCEAQITGHHFLATHGHFDHMDQAAMNCAAAIRSRT